MHSAGRNGEKPTGKSHSLQIVERCTHWPLQCDAKTCTQNQGKTFLLTVTLGYWHLLKGAYFIRHKQLTINEMTGLQMTLIRIVLRRRLSLETAWCDKNSTHAYTNIMHIYIHTHIHIYIRTYINTFPRLVTSLYNGCLRKGCFPKRWKKARIISLTKPGKENCNDTSKYRPISLLNVGGKVLEKLLISRIMYFLNWTIYWIQISSAFHHKKALQTRQWQ